MDAAPVRTGPPSSALIAGHRRDIEGLRAVAVAAVVLYHARVPGFSGGYVGVDVFFVLSGYLMTGLLVGEHRANGSIDFGAFYARRLRRLLPVSVLVLVSTTVASWFIVPPRVFERVAADVTAAGAYLVNFRFATEATDYLGDDVGASPVLHYWSLAVEEQFYLVWPLSIGLVLAVAAGRRVLPMVLAAISGVSFVIAVVWTREIQPWAFFSLPARAWEFGAGALAVLASRRIDRTPSPLRSAAGWLGMAAVVAAIITFDETTQFPGPMAVAPVLGTASVLVAHGAHRAPGSLLSKTPLQWVGRHSYGIYLWHWPPLVLASIWVGRDLHVTENLAICLGAVGLAAVSLRLVEDPVRYSRALMHRSRGTLSMAAALTVVAVTVPVAMSSFVDLSGGGVAAVVTRGVVAEPPDRRPVPADLRPSLIDVDDDLPGDLYESGCHVDQQGEVPRLPCEYGDVDSSTTVMLFGDSHMAQWFPAFEDMSVEHRIRLLSRTKSGCPSASMAVYNSAFERRYDECDAWRNAVIEEIRRKQPDVVVLANLSRSSAGFPDEPAGFEERWLSALSTTVEAIRPHVDDVVVLAPTPRPPADVPDCVSDHLDDSTPCDLHRAGAVDSARSASERDLVDGLGAHYLDGTRWFCATSTCPAVIGPYLVYRDASHVTSPYMRWLARSLAEVWTFEGLPTGS